MKATWNGTTLAESDNTIVVEDNRYFPPNSMNEKYFHKTDHRYECPWKGTARYFTVEVDGEENEDAAWVYPHPKEAAQKIAGYVAFWNGVEVKE